MAVKGPVDRYFGLQPSTPLSLIVNLMVIAVIVILFFIAVFIFQTLLILGKYLFIDRIR